MSRLKGSSFFCEDLRVEYSGQPIFIGVLSPKFAMSELPTRMRSLFFTSIFYATKENQDIPLTLSITVTGADEDNSHVCGTFHREISSEMIEDDGENLVVISLPLHGVHVNAGTTICASLSYLDFTEDYHLEFVDVEDMD